MEIKHPSRESRPLVAPLGALVAVALACAIVIAPGEAAAQNCACECSIAQCSACAFDPPCYAFCVPRTGECEACVLGPLAATDTGTRVSVKGDARAVSDALSEALGTTVEFQPPGEVAEDNAFQLVDFPLWLAIASLAEVGEVTINGEPFRLDGRSSDAAPLFASFLADPIHFQVSKVNSDQLSEVLSRAAGTRIVYRGPEVSLDAKEVTGLQLLDLLAEKGRLTVAGVPWAEGRGRIRP